MIRAFFAFALFAVCAVSLGAQVGDIRGYSVLPAQPDFDIQATTDAVMSPDGRFVFLVSPGDVGISSGVISARVIEGRMRVISRVDEGTTRLQQLALSRDGRRLAAVGSSGTAIFYDVHPLTGQLTELGRILLTGLISADHQPLFNAQGTVLYWGNSNAPGEMRVLDADPAGGIDSIALQSFVLGSSVEPFRMALSGDGNTLVVAGAKRTNLIPDILYVFDVLPDGTLADTVFPDVGRMRFEPGTDFLWDQHHNPLVDFFGTVAYVIDASSATPRILEVDLTQTGSVTAETNAIATEAAPLSLAMSDEENVIANVCESHVVIFGEDPSDPTPGLLHRLGTLSPGQQIFTENNSALLDASGTLCTVASEVSGTLVSFMTIPDEPGGTITEIIDSISANPGTTSLGAAAAARKIVLLNASTDAVGVFQVMPLDPVLTAVTELDDSSITFDASNAVVVDVNGKAAHATSSTVDAANGSMVTIDSISTEIVQTTPDLRRQPDAGAHLVISEGGEVLAAADAISVTIYSDSMASTPVGTFSVPGAFDGVHMAIRADGSRLYVPNGETFEIHSVDTSNPSSAQSFTMAESPVWATLSPDETQLAVTIPSIDSVAIFDVNGDGTLVTPPQTFSFPAGLDADNNVVFVGNGNRAFVGVGDSLHIFDPNSGLIDSLDIGNDVSRIIAVPGRRRILALQPLDGQVSLIQVASDDSMRVAGGVTGISLAPTAFNQGTVTPDGLLAVIPSNLPSTDSGVWIFETMRPGFAFEPLDSGDTGETSSLDIDSGGAFVASLDNTTDRLVIQQIARGEAPRLTRAVLIDNDGGTPGVGELGEFIHLSFDPPIRPPSDNDLTGDFFLFGGGSFGTGALLIPNPNSLFTQAIVVLGLSPSNIVAGDTGQGIDLIPNTFNPAIQSLSRIPAIDLGVPNINDAGVIILVPMSSASQSIQAATGGTVSLAETIATAFSRHGLQIPAFALTGDANFSIEPPAVAFQTAGFANAVRFSTDAANPGTLFNPPAIITVEIDPSSFSYDMGQLPYLVRIVQLVDVGGTITPLTFPGEQTVDLINGTVSVPVTNFDPTGQAATGVGTLGTGGAGVFATLPVNPVEQRTIFIGPGSGAAITPAAVAALSSAGNGAYLEHRIEFPGYVEVSEGGHQYQVTIRTSTIFERVSLSGGQSFPTQSGAVFSVVVLDASDSPVSFTDPVNLTVQFIDRASASETDVVDFSSVVGAASQMRIVRDAQAGSGVDFQFLGGSRSDSTVVLTGHTPLAGADGLGIYGTVVDTSVDLVSSADIVNHLLGITELVGDDFTSAASMSSPSNVIDAADLVSSINAGL